MKINIAPRFQSAKFWLTLLPALTLLVQVVGVPFGYKWDFVILNQQLADIVNAVFGVLTIIGVVVDPTTAGIGDSEQALTYGPLITSKSQQIADLQAQVKALKDGETALAINDAIASVDPTTAFATKADSLTAPTKQEVE